jgi:radical SAM protein with 4Fe4S-binding SPASM domain
MDSTQINGNSVSPTRHGSFLGAEVSQEHLKLIDELKTMIDATYANKDSDQTYESDVIEGLYRDLNSEQELNSINTSSSKKFQLSHQEVEWLAKNPKNIWLDYITYRYQFKVYPKMRKLLDFPLYLLIEPTPICNIRCTMCFQVDPIFNTKAYRDFMDIDLFKSLVDQAVEGKCRAITLASRGEPTLHPKFGEMLQYLNESKIMDIKVNTNATRLTEKLIHNILSAGVHEVVFSVDAATKKTYEEIRVGGKFDQVVRNIELFNEIRKRDYPNSRTVSRITGVKIREDQDLGQMQEFWSKRVDQVAMKNAILRWDSYNNPPSDEKRPCSLLWERLYIWSDGTANPCDFDYQSKLAIGNINDRPIREIWQGDGYNKLRENHEKAMRNSVFPCDRCDYI